MSDRLRQSSEASQKLNACFVRTFAEQESRNNYHRQGFMGKLPPQLSSTEYNLLQEDYFGDYHHLFADDDTVSTSKYSPTNSTGYTVPTDMSSDYAQDFHAWSAGISSTTFAPQLNSAQFDSFSDAYPSWTSSAPSSSTSTAFSPWDTAFFPHLAGQSSSNVPSPTQSTTGQTYAHGYQPHAYTYQTYPCINTPATSSTNPFPVNGNAPQYENVPVWNHFTGAQDTPNDIPKSKKRKAPDEFTESRAETAGSTRYRPIRPRPDYKSNSSHTSGLSWDEPDYFYYANVRQDYKPRPAAKDSNSDRTNTRSNKYHRTFNSAGARQKHVPGNRSSQACPPKHTRSACNRGNEPSSRRARRDPPHLRVSSTMPRSVTPQPAPKTWLEQLADGTLGHYEALQVKPNATRAEIRKAWQKLSVKYHPDKDHGNEIVATARTQALNAAFAVLKDETTRARYDAKRAYVKGGR